MPFALVAPSPEAGEAVELGACGDPVVVVEAAGTNDVLGAIVADGENFDGVFCTGLVGLGAGFFLVAASLKGVRKERSTMEMAAVTRRLRGRFLV
jgi:hypothetical protein